MITNVKLSSQKKQNKTKQNKTNYKTKQTNIEHPMPTQRDRDSDERMHDTRSSETKIAFQLVQNFIVMRPTRGLASNRATERWRVHTWVSIRLLQYAVVVAAAVRR